MTIDNHFDTCCESGVHPIEMDQYTLSTKSIGQVVNKISLWSKRKIRGGIIYGRPRLGKTRTIRFVRTNIAKMFGKPVAHFLFTCARTVSNNESGFLSDLLRDLGYGLPLAGTALQKRHRVIEFLISEAQSCNDHRVILFIDEAQNLRWIHFEWLIAIYNALEMAEVQMYVYLFGQEELIAQKDAYRAENRQQIVGRFMVAKHQFTGLRSKEDLRYALARYDLHSEYPTGSGISFTKHYFPAAFLHGWRLADLTELLWSCFMEMRAQANVHGKVDIPMQAFTAVVDGILLTCGSKTNRAPNVNRTVIIQLLQESGYVELEQSVAA